MKKLWMGILGVLLVITLSACSNGGQNGEHPSNNGKGNGNNSGQPNISKQEQKVMEEIRSLFDKLVNIEANDTHEEGLRVLNEILVSPDEYLQSLENNNLLLEYGRYERVSVAHRAETLNSLGKDHYEYKSMATFEMYYDNSQEPVVGYADVYIEAKKERGKWKVVRVKITP